MAWIRRLINLREDQDQWLVAYHKTTGLSIAEIMRKALDLFRVSVEKKRTN